MLKLLKPLPKVVVVACSGGVDSMAALDFLRRKHTVTAAFYHHGTVVSERASQTVANYCSNVGVSLVTGTLSGQRPPHLSKEEWWRNTRYEWLDSLDHELGPVVTAHHLDDSVETYLWGALHGTPKVIPYSRGRVVRPFLTTRKDQMIDWCNRHSVAWSDDHTNADTAYTRNYIRHVLMPHALVVNPGIHKVVKRIIDKQTSTCDNTQLSTQEF